MAETRPRTAKPALGDRLNTYGVSHLRSFLGSLGRLWRAPLASIMTVAVIGIALALPAGFWVLLDNVQRLSGGWDGAARVSVYFELDAGESAQQALARELAGDARVKALRRISREEAMAEFKALSGFGEAMAALESNPLPAVLVITPAVKAANPESLKALVAELEQRPAVELAQLDLQWVKRLYTLMDFVQRGLMIIGAMLGLAVILIVGNTIRLDIQNRRIEIEVQKLIGATDGFIRRPFLYTGFWYGLLGGLLAWILVQGGLSLLSGPAQRLAGLYDSGFRLAGLGLAETGALLGTAVALGYLGSWLAVGRHLKEIEPA